MKKERNTKYHQNKLSPILLLTGCLLAFSFYSEFLLAEQKGIRKQYSSNKEQIECLAKNMYHEARGQGKEGMLMVGHVTLNRVESGKFPNNICQVVYQKSQFSWTRKKKSHTKEMDSWFLAMELAEDVIDRNHDKASGALYFINPKKATNTSWVKKKKLVTKKKDHVFFR